MGAVERCGLHRQPHEDGHGWHFLDGRNGQGCDGGSIHEDEDVIGLCAIIYVSFVHLDISTILAALSNIVLYGLSSCDRVFMDRRALWFINLWLNGLRWYFMSAANLFENAHLSPYLWNPPRLGRLQPSLKPQISFAIISQRPPVGRARCC